PSFLPFSPRSYQRVAWSKIGSVRVIQNSLSIVGKTLESRKRLISIGLSRTPNLRSRGFRSGCNLRDRGRNFWVQRYGKMVRFVVQMAVYDCSSESQEYRAPASSIISD